MAVSYLSKPYESNPYVVPVDLGLLAKVNQYKQSQFYQNTDKLNTQFAQLNALDIMNPYQKDHAKDVITNLSTQIQNMGGLDYSDPNVANTISGYAGDVYNDKTILNGIISTKAIRSYQANAEKIKTDPKLSKYYDPAREWYDTQYEENPNAAIHYLKGDINSKYDGPTAPTPSLGSDWDILTKEIQRINPNIDTKFDQSGNRFFITKSDGKEVTASQIRQMVDGKIDGRVADQLNVHAAYNYYGLTNGTYSKEQGVSEFNSHNTNNLKRISDAISATQMQITLEPDNEKRLDLEQQLMDLSDELPGAQKAVTQGSKDFSNLWDKSKSAAFYNLYTNKLKDDISNVYSYKQTTRNLIVNQEAIANARMDLEALKEGYKLQRNADGSLKKVKVPPTELQGQLTPDFSSSADLEKKTVTQQSIQEDIDNTQNQLNAGLRNVIFETAKIANVPGLFNDDISINNDPNANPVSHSDLLKKIAQLSGSDTQLEKKDIDRVLRNVDKAGKFSDTGEFTFNDQGDRQDFYNSKTNKPVVSLTAPQVTFFKKVQTIMDAAADGQDITGKISNASAWRQYMNKYSIEQNHVITKQKLLQTAKNQALDKIGTHKGLSSVELSEVKRFMQNPTSYIDKGGNQVYYGGTFGTAITNGSNEYTSSANQKTPAMISGLNKLGGYGQLNGEVDSLLGNLSNRKNYYSILLPDQTLDLEKQFPQIKNYLQNGDVKIDNDIVKKKDDLDPIGIVTDGTKYYIKYGSRANITGDKGYVPITEENLQAMGVPTVPYPSLEETVSENGHLPQPIYIDPAATGNAFNKANNFTGPIKIDLVNMNASGERNSDNYTPAIIYKGKEYYYKPGNNRSANAALELITNALQNNQTFTSIDQFIATLDQYNQQ